MQLDKRVQRVIAGFSGLVLMACQTPGTPEAGTIEPVGYRVYAPGALVGSFPPAPLDMEADGVIESAFGMAITDSSIFILDVMGGAVHHLNLEGTLVATLGRKGEGPGEFSSPVSIDVDGDGNVWVADPQLSRLSKFRSDGTPLADVSTPHPVVNFMPLSDGSALIPTMEARSLVAQITESGEMRTLALPTETESAILGGSVMDRLGLGAFRLAPLDADTLLLFRNTESGDFAAWRLVLDLEAGKVERFIGLPLPAWLRTMIEQSTKDFLESVASEFADQHIVVPFRSIRTIDGTIWLSPNAGDQVMLMSVPISPTDSVSVVVPNGDKATGMVDAAIIGGRLVVLTTTSVRFYELDRVAPSRFLVPH